MGGSVLSLLVTLSKYLRGDMNQLSLEEVRRLSYRSLIVHIKTKIQAFLVSFWLCFSFSGKFWGLNLAPYAC